MLEFPLAFLASDPPCIGRGRKWEERKREKRPMNSRTAGRLLSGGGISQRERRVPGGPFDCGASFIVIVGNEVGTIVVSVYILLTPCHAHTRAARSLARLRHILHPSPNHFVYLVVQRLPLWADANSIARIYMCPGCRFKPPPIYSNAIFGFFLSKTTSASFE